MQKLWPTLVHVHIPTEVLDTLCPGAKGLCLIIKIWLVTLTDENTLARCGWILVSSPDPPRPRPVGKLEREKWKEGLVNRHWSGRSRRMWGIQDICVN